jgi:hypothetical protein
VLNAGHSRQGYAAASRRTRITSSSCDGKIVRISSLRAPRAIVPDHRNAVFAETGAKLERLE